MRNLTLAIDEKILESSRKYARTHNMTLNGLIRHLLERTVRQDSPGKLDDLFRLMDEHPGDSGGWQWNREDLHER